MGVFAYPTVNNMTMRILTIISFEMCEEQLLIAS